MVSRPALLPNSSLKPTAAAAAAIAAMCLSPVLTGQETLTGQIYSVTSGQAEADCTEILMSSPTATTVGAES